MVSLLCVSCGEAWGPVWLCTIFYTINRWRVSPSYVSICALTTDAPWWTTSYTPNPQTRYWRYWQMMIHSPHGAEPGTCIGPHGPESRTHFQPHWQTEAAGEASADSGTQKSDKIRLFWWISDQKWGKFGQMVRIRTKVRKIGPTWGQCRLDFCWQLQLQFSINSVAIQHNFNSNSVAIQQQFIISWVAVQ